jgi:hypothetical protein
MKLAEVVLVLLAAKASRVGALAAGAAAVELPLVAAAAAVLNAAASATAVMSNGIRVSLCIGASSLRS